MGAWDSDGDRPLKRGGAYRIGGTGGIRRWVYKWSRCTCSAGVLSISAPQNREQPGSDDRGGGRASVHALLIRRRVVGYRGGRRTDAVRMVVCPRICSVTRRTGAKAISPPRRSDLTQRNTSSTADTTESGKVRNECPSTQVSGLPKCQRIKR